MTTANDKFWEIIGQQVAELREARTADDVVRILSHQRNPYGEDTGCEDAFFAGSGGDDTVMEALTHAGWTLVWSESDIYYTMQAPDGSKITYTEGDIRKGGGHTR